MNYQRKQFLAEDFSRLCSDLGVSEVEGYYFNCWNQRGFFENYAVCGDSYLVRIPNPAPDDLTMLDYLFSFEGRVFMVAARELGDEAWIRGEITLGAPDKQRVAEHLAAAFVANGYFGSGSWDQAGELQIIWA